VQQCLIYRGAVDARPHPCARLPHLSAPRRRSRAAAASIGTPASPRPVSTPRTRARPVAPRRVERTATQTARDGGWPP